jgi:hypothetical protein
MIKKIIITESQYNKIIKPLIKEGDYHVVLDEVLDNLNNNYEKVTAIVKDYHDYNEQPRFKVKADDTIINAKDLLDYFKYTYHGICGEEFLKQVIDDWYRDEIKDGMLSKNITLK